MTIQEPVVIIGIGEIGAVVARGVLRCGHPVYPVTRKIDLRSAAHEYPPPLAVVVAVAENDLGHVLINIPKAWRNKLVLLQNELLPKDWLDQGINEPTVCSVWFEKKRGQDVKVIVPSPVFGAHAKLISSALGTLQIPSRVLPNAEELLFELVRKNLYILTSNIAGLVVGGNTGELWQRHRNVALQVAGDVMKLQAKLVNKELPWDALIHSMSEAFLADPEHKCMGRSAPARLIRALAQADQMGLVLPKLREIQEHLG
jgi:hypothetical protein